MKIRFCIEYFAADQERLYIIFSDGEQCPMERGGNGLWSLIREVKPGTTYHYALLDAEHKVLRSESSQHTLERSQGEVTIYDRWWDTPQDMPFYSSLFTNGVFRRTKRDRRQIKPASGMILVEVAAPTLRPDQRLAIVGGNSALGAWDTSHAILMNDHSAPIWRALLPREAAGSEYKFIIVSTNGECIAFETGNNRLMPYSDSATCIVRGLRLNDSNKAWRGAGVAIPVFSLRSENSWGVGEFSDLKPMARWASKVGMSIIQLLPVNDTTTTSTWRDSYPYNAVSSFALHPLYLGARAAVGCCEQFIDENTAESLQPLLEKYSRRAAKINALKAVDYEAALKLKMGFLKELYKLCGKQVTSSKSYAEFTEANNEWLTPYSIFCVLRDKYSTTNFDEWQEMATYDKASAEKFMKRNSSKVGFYGFVQFLLDAELSDVHNYTLSLGVALKGDIPIGVSPRSADVWYAPELYNTTMSAGAPPDAFAEDGQNWGFPTYNWARMAEDGYDWWSRRLKKMARYFDAYRIDHILGFFRIWEVPREAKSAIVGHFYPSLPYSAEEILASGFDFDAQKHTSDDYNCSDVLFVRYPEGGFTPRIEGYKTPSFKALTPAQQQAYQALHEDFFYHRHNAFWHECAMRRLPRLMAKTGMLTCGEDLGMIPACVPDLMNSERILSLEIERMPKTMGVSFGDTKTYPYLSVAATSTHDMSNIRGWWQEDEALTQKYWCEVLGLEGRAEKECSAQTAQMIVERELKSNSMLAILPLQDWLATDAKLRQSDVESERINIPANPNHYWRYRMHLTLEQLLGEESFNAQVKRMVALREQ